MSLRTSWFKSLVLFSIAMLTGLLAGCSSGSSNSSTESLRIYEMVAQKGTFSAVAGDTTATSFQLNLSDVPDSILYFTNREAKEGGFDTINNVVTNIWPRAFGSLAPNAIMKATTANQGVINIFCVLNNPVYNKSTGQLSFTITYLDGNRPVDKLAFTDFKMIILNNAATAQPEVWSHLVVGDSGTFIPTKDPGIYTFSIQKAFGTAVGFTSAPHRKSSTASVKEYIQGWQARFGNTPPNASIAYNPQNNLTGAVQIVTLTNPAYDETTGSLSFTAKLLYGTAAIGASGLTVQTPSLLIDAGPGGFPTYTDNTFSIQFRNSTSDSVQVWLAGKRPPCSQDQADNCDVSDWNDSQKFKSNWESKAMQDAFAASGTHFYKVTPGTAGNTVETINVTTQIELAAGQILRIMPPTRLKNGVPVPEWYFKDEAFNEKHESLGKKVQTAGANAWVTNTTRSGASIYMPAPEPVLLYEYFPAPQSADGKTPPTIWYDMSGVDGINAKATMAFEGIACQPGDNDCLAKVSSLYKRCAITLEDYSAQNPAGCPKSMVFANANTCPNPKKYDKSITSTEKPDWVTGTDSFTIADLQDQLYKNILTSANTTWGHVLTGLDLASAASDQATIKPAYHIWWSTNPVGQGWLSYLQTNADGRCDAYGWAYDEKKWLKGQSLTFDSTNGNPINEDGSSRDNPLKPLVSYPYVKDTYLNIDILQVKK